MRALLIDAGNTRVKWAVWSDGAPPGEWRAFGDAPTASLAPLAGVLAQAAREHGIASAIRCSVAGAAVEAELDRQLHAAGIGDLRRFVSVGRVGPLENAYANPAQLGADRLAAALGAWQRIGGGALVVGAGTATTIDVLRGEGGRAVFAGGVILPGVDLMIASLARNTARLPPAAGRFTDLPDNTDDAMVSGCLQAQLGAIARMRAQLPPGTPCVLAGGAAERLLPHCAPPVVHAPGLVLEGLAVAILHGAHE